MPYKIRILLSFFAVFAIVMIGFVSGPSYANAMLSAINPVLAEVNGIKGDDPNICLRKENLDDVVEEETYEVKVEKKKTKEARSAMTVSMGANPMPILSQNWVTLSAVHGKNEVGTLDAYIGARGTFLRLDVFLRYLHVPYGQQTTSDILEIVENGRHISIDITQRTYVEDGVQFFLYDNDAFINDDKIYANTSLLYRLFPDKAFLVSQSLKQIRILTQPKLEENTKKTKAKDLAPPPVAAPIQPVIIDDLTQQQVIVELPQAENTDYISEASNILKDKGALQVSLPSKKHYEEISEESVLPDGESLILQPQLKKLPIGESFIEAIIFNKQVFLPLNDLFQIIGFQIKFDKTQNRAKGFLFDLKNKFSFNFENKKIVVGANDYTYSKKEVRKYEGQIYINIKAFSDWFDITCTVDHRHGILKLDSDKMFPQEEDIARQNRWGKLLSKTNKKDEPLLFLENDYKFIDYPTIDILLGSNFSHTPSLSTKKDDFTSNYKIQGAMELGYLTNEFYIQGASNNNILNTFRLKSGRKDPTASLLGPMKATSFSIGDVPSPSISLVTSSSLGRGVTITNRALNTSENFDVRTFTGDSTPGYAVELYRNNVLLEFRTIGPDGRYTFNDIPILYSENTFRLLFYGPQGQREERVEKVSASKSFLKKNEFEYTLGLAERGVSLIPVNKVSTSNSKTPNGAQLTVRVRYGLTPNITVGAALAETQLEDKAHRYVTAFSSANIFGVLSEINFAKDLTQGGWAAGASALGGFDGVSLRARYRYYNDFISESVNNISSPLKSEVSISTNAQVFLPVVQGFNLGLSGLKETFLDASLKSRYTYGMHFTKSLWGASFSNKLNYIVDQNTRMQDVFGVQTRIWNTNFRATGIYEFSPVQQFRNASFMADYKLSDKLSGQSSIEKDITTDKTSFGQNINWDFEKFRLSLNNRYSDEGSFSVGMNVLFSLNHNKVNNKIQIQNKQMASGGAIAGRVFVDENNNDIYDDGEVLVSDAKLRIDRAAIKLDKGGFFVAPIAPYGFSEIRINDNIPSNPMLTSKIRGYRVRTRPGDTVVTNFPLVLTTLIDGTTYFVDADVKREIGNIIIELQDKNHKPLRRIVSEIDGYYSFDKVQKGEYWISIPDEVLSSINASVINKIHIIIDEIDGFISDKDIFLQQKEDLSEPPISNLPVLKGN